MSEIEPVGMSHPEAMRLLRHTLEQLEIHLDDPDGSSLSGQGMLEATRDRLSTLYALLVSLVPAPADPRFSAECPRCFTCSEPILWSESRQNWTHRNYVAVPHAVTTQQPAPERQPEPVAGRWEDTRDDDGRWLSGASGCPRGCGHVLMAHRTDVGCVTCDCEHGIPGRGADLIDREKSHVLPADLVSEHDADL